MKRETAVGFDFDKIRTCLKIGTSEFDASFVIPAVFNSRRLVKPGSSFFRQFRKLDDQPSVVEERFRLDQPSAVENRRDGDRKMFGS